MGEEEEGHQLRERGGHYLQEEVEGVQRRMPSVFISFVYKSDMGLTLAMGAILYDLVAIRVTFIIVCIVCNVDEEERVVVDE